MMDKPKTQCCWPTSGSEHCSLTQQLIPDERKILIILQVLTLVHVPASLPEAAEMEVWEQLSLLIYSEPVPMPTDSFSDFGTILGHLTLSGGHLNVLQSEGRRKSDLLLVWATLSQLWTTITDLKKYILGLISNLTITLINISIKIIFGEDTHKY